MRERLAVKPDIVTDEKGVAVKVEFFCSDITTSLWAVEGTDF